MKQKRFANLHDHKTKINMSACAFFKYMYFFL